MSAGRRPQNPLEKWGASPPHLFQWVLWYREGGLLRLPRSTISGPGQAAVLCQPGVSAVVYAVMLLGRKPGFRAGFRPGSSRERLKIGPAADFEAFPMRIRPKFKPEARFPARKHYCVT